MSSRDGESPLVFLRQLMAVDFGLIRRCQRNGGCRVGCEYDRTDDSRLPWDADGYGGWGGHDYHDTAPGADRPPVVFVHGNQRDACDWEAHAEFFRNRSYGGDELWAITTGDPSPDHDTMADQLEDFVGHVRTETGADEVSVVSHSLGVTGLRYWLHREDRYDWVDSFVGIAGANHGSKLCSLAARVGLDEGMYEVCEFIRADTAADDPLGELNENETPGDVDYYTVRGTDDPLFMQCPESPELDGAVNVVLKTDHDGARASITSIERVYEWLSGESPYNMRSFLPDG